MSQLVGCEELKLPKQHIVQCDQLIYVYLVIFRLFEKSQTHSICNFKKPCLLECQPKNVKSFQCKTRDKTLLCKSQYFFHKNMSQKEQLCAGKIYGPTDRVSGNDPFSFVTSWFEWETPHAFIFNIYRIPLERLYLENPAKARQ